MAAWNPGQPIINSKPRHPDPAFWNKKTERSREARRTDEDSEDQSVNFVPALPLGKSPWSGRNPPWARDAAGGILHRCRWQTDERGIEGQIGVTRAFGGKTRGGAA